MKKNKTQLLNESLDILKSFLVEKKVNIENTGIEKVYYSFKPFNYETCNEYCKNGNGSYNEDFILSKKISYESQFLEFLDYVKKTKNDDALLFICLKKTPLTKSYDFHREFRLLLENMSHNQDILFEFVNRTNVLESGWEEFNSFMPYLNKQQQIEVFNTIFKTKTFTNISSQKIIYQKFLQYIPIEDQSELLPFFYKLQKSNDIKNSKSFLDNTVEKSSLVFTFNEQDIMNLNLNSKIQLPSHINNLRNLTTHIVENKKEKLGVDFFHIDYNSETKSYTFSIVMDSSYININKIVFKNLLVDSFSQDTILENKANIIKFEKKLLNYLIEYDHSLLSSELKNNKKESNKMKI